MAIEGLVIRRGDDGEFEVRSAKDLDVLQNSVSTIVMTKYGDRVMLPGFGSRVPTFLGSSMVITNIQMLRLSVEEALKFWESRVSLNYVDMSKSNADIGMVSIHIGYTPIWTNTMDKFNISVKVM